MAGGLLNVGALALAACAFPRWIPVAGLSGDILSTALMITIYLRRGAAGGPKAPKMLS